MDWIKAAGGLATAFDVTTKGILHAVFEVGGLLPTLCISALCYCQQYVPAGRTILQVVQCS